MNEELKIESARLKFQLMYAVGLLTTKAEQCENQLAKMDELEGSNKQIEKMQVQVAYLVRLLQIKARQNAALKRESRQK